MTEAMGEHEPEEVDDDDLGEPEVVHPGWVYAWMMLLLTAVVLGGGWCIGWAIYRIVVFTTTP